MDVLKAMLRLIYFMDPFEGICYRNPSFHQELFSSVLVDPLMRSNTSP